MKLNELKGAEYNPRKISDKAKAGLSYSLENFGDLAVITFNRRTQTLVTGHQRKSVLEARENTLEVLKEYKKPTKNGTILIGLITVDGEPFLYREVDWDEKKEKMGNVAANNPEIQGEFTQELQIVLDEIMFEPGYADLRLNELYVPPVEENNTTEDDFDMTLAKEVIIKEGDLIELNDHRLMCGDSTKPDHLIKLMNGQLAQMLFTDPPYLMGFEGNVHADGSKSFNAKHGKILNDKMSREDGDEFISSIMDAIQDYVIGGYYICFYRLGLDYVFRALDKAKMAYKALIIWDKGNHTLSNSDYMSKYEPIVYGWVRDHNFYGDRSNFDIWSIQRTQKNDLHPTMKPIELVGKAIVNSSRQGDSILDLFMGSGSTLIAAEQLGRKTFGMELDPKYCDVIIRRWYEWMQKNNKATIMKLNGIEVKIEDLVHE